MRLDDVLFSLLFHVALITAVLACSAGSEPLPPKVYEVTLAEFAGPAQAAAPVQPEARPEPPRPESRPETPKPRPVKKEKAISARKVEKATPAPEEPRPEEPAPPEPPKAEPRQSASEGPAGPAAPAGSGRVAKNVGGILAYDADAVDTRPSVLRRVVPEYPTQARRLHQEGRVLVRLVVDEQGNPQACSVHKADPPDVFDDAALRAARRFRFVPGRVDGHFVATLVLIPFVFNLR